MKAKTRKVKFFEESLILIHEKGYKATTMRDIADRMGFKVANVYNYIKKKEILLETYLFNISGEFHKGIAQISSSSYSPKEKLKAVVSLHVRLTAQKPYEIALLLNEWRHLKEPKLGEFIAERNEYEESVKAIVKEGMQQGELREMDIDIATHAVLSCVRWLYDKYTKHSKNVNPVELEKQLTDFILRGIG